MVKNPIGNSSTNGYNTKSHRSHEHRLEKNRRLSYVHHIIEQSGDSGFHLDTWMLILAVIGIIFTSISIKVN